MTWPRTSSSTVVLCFPSLERKLETADLAFSILVDLVVVYEVMRFWCFGVLVMMVALLL